MDDRPTPRAPASHDGMPSHHQFDGDLDKPPVTELDPLLHEPASVLSGDTGDEDEEEEEEEEEEESPRRLAILSTVIILVALLLVVAFDVYQYLHPSSGPHKKKKKSKNYFHMNVFSHHYKTDKLPKGAKKHKKKHKHKKKKHKNGNLRLRQR